MKRKSGFTIIEVVLVLAIAALIFLMVFIALPTLQRNQRDTQRRDLLDRVIAQVQNYQANNNNNTPGAGQTPALAQDAWNAFRTGYMLVGADTFVDPDGRPWVFVVDTTVATGADGATVSNWAQQVPSRDTQLTVNNGGQAGSADGAVPVYVYLGGRCNGETPVSAGSGATRRYAVRVKLEGAGTYCRDNS